MSHMVSQHTEHGCGVGLVVWPLNFVSAVYSLSQCTPGMMSCAEQWQLVQKTAQWMCVSRALPLLLAPNVKYRSCHESRRVRQWHISVRNVSFRMEAPQALLLTFCMTCWRTRIFKKLLQLIPSTKWGSAFLLKPSQGAHHKAVSFEISGLREKSHWSK